MKILQTYINWSAQHFEIFSYSAKCSAIWRQKEEAPPRKVQLIADTSYWYFPVLPSSLQGTDTVQYFMDGWCLGNSLILWLLLITGRLGE